MKANYSLIGEGTKQEERKKELDAFSAFSDLVKQQGLVMLRERIKLIKRYILSDLYVRLAEVEQGHYQRLEDTLKAVSSIKDSEIVQLDAAIRLAKENVSNKV